jgi:serine/threonine protein phosphatase PrpC
VGRVRSSNQDSLLIDEQHRLFAVADGMGGHAGGEVASKMAVELMREYFVRHADDGPLGFYLAQGIQYACGKIFEKALEEPNLRGMGTTLTAIHIDHDGSCVCAHVGDSRLYLVRCGFIFQLTQDHSLVAEQLRSGMIKEEDIANFHFKNVITRSVGYQEEEDIDRLELKLMPKDVLILTSDGLHGLVKNRIISDMSTKLGPKAVRELIGSANRAGGEDNITVVMIEVSQ